MTAAVADATKRFVEPFQRLLNLPKIGAAIKAGLAIAALMAAVKGIFHAPTSIIFDGIAIGSLYGLIGAAVILIYRTNRIINFAAAGMGAVPAVFGVLLIVNKGWSWYIAFPLALVGGALAGGLTDYVVIRRFANAPRLILTVVTIGVSQFFAFLALYVPRWIGAKNAGFISKIDTPFRPHRFNLGNRVFYGDFVFAPIFVLVLIIALTLFFRYTRIGIALRASAENADRASLLGIPVRRVGTVAWVIAGLFASATIFLRSTLVGVPVDGTLGYTVLLYALTAAVVARMESIPLALAAGVGIGMLDRASVFATARSTLAGAIMLVVILIVLLLQRGKLSRAQDAGVSTWQAVKEFRPIPHELRNIREVQLARGALAVISLALVLLAPTGLMFGDSGLNRLVPIPIYAIVAVSLVILTGWAGQISLGQMGLVGIAATVGGGWAANHNIDFFAVLGVGILSGALAAILIGLPAVRIQGLYLAVTTLAFAGAVQGYFLNPTYPFGERFLPDSANRITPPMLLQRIDMSNGRNYYYFCVVALGAVLLAARAYRRNRAGRILIAVRDNQRAAPSYAINLTRNRLAAFAMSGAFAAVAGILFAYQQQSIDPSSYGIGPSVEIFTITVIGGLTSLPGAVLGSIAIVMVKYFGESLFTGMSLLVTGPGLVLILMFLPGGLAEGMYRLRDGFLRWVANRHNILVPSLVADKRVETGEDQQAVITQAEEHVEEVDSFDLTHVPTITCPVCEQVLTLEDAPEHEHLRGLPEPEPEPVGTAGGGRERLGRAREGRR